MSGTPNLGLTYLTSGQLQPEVTVNGDLNALDALLPLAASFANNPATTSGLTFGYYGGYLWAGTTATVVAAGTVALTASATNYVQITTAGVVSVNTTGFTSGQIPLATVATGASSITSIADKRPMAVGGGGGMSNPMTTLADIIVGGTSGAPTRFAAPTAAGTYGLTYTPGGGFAWTVGGATTVPVLPVNAQTGTTYTPALADAPAANGYQGVITMNNASANTLTVPPNSSVAWPVGAQIQVVQLGAGQTTIAPGAGVTVSSPSTLTARAQYSSLVLTQVAANVWVLGGDMT
jgi:hypothetical protein